MKAKIGLIFAISLVMATFVLAQDCFQDFVKRGINTYEQYQFQQAIDLFNAAKICPDIAEAQIEEIDGWITKANNGYINEITKARDEAVALQKEAVKQARFSEANRLAYLAAEELEKKNLVDALLLAYNGLDMVSEEPMPQVKQIFGNVVGRSDAVIMKVSDKAVLGGGFLAEGHFWSRSRDQSVQILNADKNPVGTLELEDVRMTAAQVSPDGSIIATGFETGDLMIWDSHGKLLGHDSNGEGSLSRIAFSDAGDLLVTAYRVGARKIWSAQGQLQAENRIPNASIKDLKIFGEAPMILIRSAEHAVYIMDSKAQIVGKIQHNKHIYRAGISPDSKTILTCSADSTAVLSSLDGQMLAQLKHPAVVHKAIFSPDGQTVLTASLDHQIRIWDLAGNLLHTVRSDETIIQSVQFSSDGNYMLSFGSDHTARLWNNQGQLVAQLDRHTGPILSSAFSPNSQLILTTSADKTAKLWDLKGALLMSANQYVGAVTSGKFSPDGEQIMTTSEDGHVVLLPNPITAFQLLRDHPPIANEDQKIKYGLSPQQ